MKYTVLTDREGRILASLEGHASELRERPGPYATVCCGPDQELHEIEVPREVAKLAADELHPALLQHLPGRSGSKG